MLPNLIVPTLNRYDLLQRLVDSIDYPVKHLLIIDNGAGLDSLHVPDCVKDWTVLPMPSNLGVATSWNLGIKCFPKDNIWFIVSDDVVFEPGGLAKWHGASYVSQVTVSDEWPFFQLMAVGEQVVENVGLFDESLHPANFEDDDYEWRCDHFGFDVRREAIPHSHVKQGTVFHSDFKVKNEKTYPLNEIYFRYKQSQQDYSAGQWSLSRRRVNSWD